MNKPRRAIAMIESLQQRVRDLQKYTYFLAWKGSIIPRHIFAFGDGERFENVVWMQHGIVRTAPPDWNCIDPCTEAGYYKFLEIGEVSEFIASKEAEGFHFCEVYTDFPECKILEGAEDAQPLIVKIEGDRP